MQYIASIFSGLSGSALFWILDKKLLNLKLAQTYQFGWMALCFVVFGVLGYWLFSRAPQQPEAKGTRVASGLKGKNIKINIDGVTATGRGQADILSNLDAKGDIEADVKNIKN